MEVKIELWLRGYLFTTETIQLPEFDDKWGFQRNVEFREATIKANIMKITADYWAQIDKCEGRYQVYLSLPSRMDLVGEEMEIN
jgi:hypothetical protein